MQKANEKLSVRKIHQRLGGSFSTIFEFMQRYQKEHALAESVDSDISNELRQALLAEFAKVTLALKERLQAQLLEKEERLKEAQDLLVDYETQLGSLKQQLTKTQEESRALQLKLEKQLSAAESSMEREKKCQQQVEQFREKFHQAELKAAVNETKVKELDKQILILQKKSSKS